jgi:rhodanese-related sulfurtransferase
MKKLNIIVILFVTFFIVKYSFAESLESVLPDLALKLQTESKAIIIDVREPIELISGKIKGAKVIPMSLMNNDRESWNKKIAEIKKDKTVILYCHSGRRANLVGTELSKLGFKVLNQGGYDNWKSKGLPTEKE